MVVNGKSARNESSANSQVQRKRRSDSPGRQIARENSDNFNGINDKIKSVLKQNHKLESENQRLFDLMSKVKNDQKSEIDRALNSYVSEINHLRSSMSTHASENGRLKLQVENLNQKSEEQLKQITTINSSLQSRIAENEKLVSENSNLKARLDVEKAKSQEFYRISEDAKKQSTDLAIKLDSLDQKLAKEKLKFIDMENKMMGDLEKAKFESQLAAGKNVSKSDKNMLDDATNQDLNTSQEIFVEQEKVSLMYENKLRELKSTLAAAHGEEVANLENLIADQDHLISTVKQENKSLQTQLEAERSNTKLLEEMRKKLEDFREKNFKLAKDLADKRSEMNEVSEINSTLKYNIETLTKHLDFEDSRQVANESFLPKRFKFENNNRNLYTEITSDGPIRITYVSPDGESVEIVNNFAEDILLGGLKLVQQLSDGKKFEKKFGSDDKIAANDSITITSVQLKLDDKSSNLLSIGNQKQLDTYICGNDEPDVARYIIRGVNGSKLQNITGYISKFFSK